MALAIGQNAENIVASYLSKQGYKLIAKNVRYPFGEIDLILLDKDTMVFCEVKYRRHTSYGLPLEAVNSKKQQKILLAAKAYLSSYKSMPWCRFDVVTITGDLLNPIIDHIKDAFMDEY